eukprot:SAG22_NODE_415_length_10814_cov_10.762109_3_plen_237_part_00
MQAAADAQPMPDVPRESFAATPNPEGGGGLPVPALGASSYAGVTRTVRRALKGGGLGDHKLTCTERWSMTLCVLALAAAVVVLGALQASGAVCMVRWTDGACDTEDPVGPEQGNVNAVYTSDSIFASAVGDVSSEENAAAAAAAATVQSAESGVANAANSAESGAENAADSAESGAENAADSAESGAENAAGAAEDGVTSAADGVAGGVESGVASAEDGVSGAVDGAEHDVHNVLG